jgi:hypothetical protein
MKFPLRHLSIRVPWHDSGWNGTVCKAPHLNGACALLKGIAPRKREADELLHAGRSLETLDESQWPPCVDERGAFMSPFEIDHIRRHALARKNQEHYGHFQETKQRYPAFSAPVVPFRWLMRDNLPRFRDTLDLDVDPDREPDVGYRTNWVHEVSNQRALLDAFADHVAEQQSLCLFYAKHVPFVEGTDRVLVGVGRVAKKGELIEYKLKGSGPRGMVWERPVQHTIRLRGGDGFLFPYAELLAAFEADPSLDISRYAPRAPSEHWEEFSYGSELVTHDGAIGALLSMDSCLSRMESELGIVTAKPRSWVHDDLIRLWFVRGPYPGLGAVLTAFGLSRGVFVAHAIQQKAGENTDPWPLVDNAFKDPASVLPADLTRDLKELTPTWKGLSAERRSYLRLLSRFELSREQAVALYEADSRRAAGWDATDKELLANPYRIYELTRHDPFRVGLLALDRGVFPDDVVRNRHPLDEPSRVESPVDIRRIRAASVSILESAADSGHTLVAVSDVVQAITELPLRPLCPVTGDSMNAAAEGMEPEVVAIELDAARALQLSRYRDLGEEIRKQVNGRVGGKRHAIKKDWPRVVSEKFGVANDSEEKAAQSEKAAALQELYSSRLSVLAGPAGAGKTSVLALLCAQPEIQADGVLLLAPTGKARVRMQQLAGTSGGKALTVAQFLNQHGRYETHTGRYVISESPKASGYGTVIIDEASMLTEDMLGALFNAFSGVKRFVLVGDPSQLPPIGAGRPFVDIVAKLRPPEYESMFPRVAAGYAELTKERRQIGAERPDLRLARWFSATRPGPSEDDVFDSPLDTKCIRFVEWKDADDFQTRLLDVLTDELELKGPDDVVEFNRKLGAKDSGEWQYFNAGWGGRPAAVSAVENWQILSPIRNQPYGVGSINRQIHERFRKAFVELATSRYRPIPKPFGAERIVYGDKVINLSNHKRDGKRVYPREGALGYLANGEVGIAVGLWKNGAYPKMLKVEFSSQPGFTYDFYENDFTEEGNASLELAYALTVHKAQGSQFGRVILVLPEAHPLLSRELIYTALTRHQNRVIIMHQGPRPGLKEFAAPHRSETARRRTNLMQPCRMVEIPLQKGSVFLQDGLIHRTSRGLPVRSKSELIIAEALTNAKIHFEYEKPLVFSGQTRYPDFTIEDEISGRTVYWEHLGMLDRADYRSGWQAKLAWYRANGVLPVDEGEGSGGMLVTTTETSGAFDASTVQKLIQRHLSR